MRRPTRTVAAAVILAVVGIASADDPLPLSLSEAVQSALEHNPDLHGARLRTRIRQHGVAVEAARFGRSVRAGVIHQAQRAPSISTLEDVTTATSSLIGFDVSVDQQLVSGGQVGLTFRNRRSWSNAAYRLIDPVYESEFGIEFIQPLLRGRGTVNRTDLRLARNDLESARVSHRERARDLRAQVLSAYWDLYFTIENRAVQAQLADGARRVLETARTRADMGAGPRSEILQAEVGVARRQEHLIVAEGQVHSAEDQLKSLTGLDRKPALWDRRLRLTTIPREGAVDSVDLRAGVERAVRADPGLRRGELRVQSLDLLARRAKDMARPQIDLSARVGLSGIGDSYADDAEALGKADGRSWTGSVNLRIPLGEDPQAERHRQRLLEKESGIIDLERRRLAVVQQVREQYRRVTISRRRTEVSDLAVKLALQNVAEQEERQNLGLSSARQVLDAQDELAETRALRLQAGLDYSKATIEWNRLVGPTGPVLD